MGCCGGKAKKAAGGAAKVVSMRATLPQTADGLVKMVYTGPKKGDFRLTAPISRTKYRVPGQGHLLVVDTTGVQGVYPQDVAWLRSAAQGRDFQVVEEPKPAPALAPEPIAPVAAADSEAWNPAIMESPVDVPASKPVARKPSSRTRSG